MLTREKEIMTDEKSIGKNEPEPKPDDSGEIDVHLKERVTSVLEEFREVRQDFYRIWGPVLALTVLSFFLAWFFVEPAPPSSLVIAAGPADGAYYAYAKQYQEVFAENGVELVVRETAGSVENYRLLVTDDDVHVAIIQGGTTPNDAEVDEFESLASLYLEPVWVFTSGEVEFTDLLKLDGMRVAIGKPRSGTNALSRLLLDVNGLDHHEDDDQNADGEQEYQHGVKVVEVGGMEAVKQLKEGDIDAAVFVLPPRSQLIQRLLSDPDLRPMSFERQMAYKQLFPYMSAVTLAEGVIDLQKNLPDKPIDLIAPVANLVAIGELHDAFVPLFIKAARRVHGNGGVFNAPGEFPSLGYCEFRPNDIAVDFFESGPSFLHRHTPFWIATLISRAKILMLPLIALSIPLFKAAPPIYRWRIRSRIYKWYKVLREIDQRRRTESTDKLAEYVKKLEDMGHELEEMKVPLSYMEEFYNLRLHIDLVQRNLRDSISTEQPTEQIATEQPTGNRDD